jgi:hypothetical protein
MKMSTTPEQRAACVDSLASIPTKDLIAMIDIEKVKSHYSKIVECYRSIPVGDDEWSPPL